jgi:hypothetical protein
VTLGAGNIGVIVLQPKPGSLVFESVMPTHGLPVDDAKRASLVLNVACDTRLAGKGRVQAATMIHVLMATQTLLIGHAFA